MVDPYEARQPGAPRLYDTVKDNISVRAGDGARRRRRRARRCRDQGEREDSRRRAAIRCQWKRAAAVAAPDPITRGLTIWDSNQGPHGFRNEIAQRLRSGQNQVRAIAPEVGGGFGCKFGAYHEDYIAAALALLLKRPVKWIETRSEHFLATNHGRNQWGEFEVGADRDGRIQALRGARLARFRGLSQGARIWPGAPG